MLTKTNSNGERISKVDQDILEIENNLNLELLRLKKLEEMKTEKRVDIVIREAPGELEQDYQYMDVEYEDEKAADAIESRKPRTGTEYIAIHKDLTNKGESDDKLTIPYVSKKVFLKAKANYAEQTKQMSADSIIKHFNPIKNFKLSLTIDGISLIPADMSKIHRQTFSNLDNSNDDQYASVEQDSRDEDSNALKDSRNISFESKQHTKVTTRKDVALVQKLLIENRTLNSQEFFAALIDASQYQELCKTPFSKLKGA